MIKPKNYWCRRRRVHCWDVDVDKPVFFFFSVCLAAHAGEFTTISTGSSDPVCGYSVSRWGQCHAVYRLVFGTNNQKRLPDESRCGKAIRKQLNQHQHPGSQVIPTHPSNWVRCITSQAKTLGATYKTFQLAAWMAEIGEWQWSWHLQPEIDGFWARSITHAVGAKEISNKKSSCWLRLWPEKGSDVEKIIQINLNSDISGEKLSQRNYSYWNVHPGAPQKL